MSKRLPVLLLVLFAVAAVGWVLRNQIVETARELPLVRRFFRTTVASQIATYGGPARSRLIPLFNSKRISYPPDRVAFVAVKSERQLEVYCAAREAPYAYVTSYPILGASGHLGPKLRFGDFQVPEGMYELTLEPNTPYHLALRLNYPNDADLARAQSDGRNPGSDILIHGTTGSIGCLAMGDPASEDLFVLVHDARVKKVPLIIAPVDLRQQAAPQQKPTAPVWLPDLYRDIKQAMSIFRKPVDDSSSTNSRR